MTTDQGGAFVIASPEVRAENSGAVYLIAGRVKGIINAVFDLHLAAALAAAVGATVGGLLVLLAGALLGRRRWPVAGQGRRW